MINTDEIKPEMPVVCSLDGPFAVVDHMECASSIKLNKDGLCRGSKVSYTFTP